MMRYLNKDNIYDIIANFSIVLLVIIYFYKINLINFIPVTGDELNSILVYSTNIKTLFLKNYPGNVTFFYLIGYLKSIFIGYELISYRSITFLFFIMHFIILKKMNFSCIKNLIFFAILISSYFSYYVGQYIGYVFSSFIFVTIFFLLTNNQKEKNNNIIFFLLFIQLYNHLVNLYLVGPIIIALFILSSNKIKFIKKFILYFIFPILLFYTLSILLTGLAENKVSNTDFGYIFNYVFENKLDIFSSGFKRIFFFEAYTNANTFDFKSFFLSLFIFDKIYFVLFLSSILISIINLKQKKIELIFSLILIFHFIFLILINKDPAPRIFSGFVCFYIFFILLYFKNYLETLTKLQNKLIYFGILIFLIITMTNFNYLKLIYDKKKSADFNFEVNKISITILKKNCNLQNNNFSEIQKRNFYFNYLNLCNKKFDLSEYLRFYRS